MSNSISRRKRCGGVDTACRASISFRTRPRKAEALTRLVSLAVVGAGNTDGWAAVSRSRLPKPPFIAQTPGKTHLAHPWGGSRRPPARLAPGTCAALAHASLPALQDLVPGPFPCRGLGS